MGKLQSHRYCEEAVAVLLQVTSRIVKVQGQKIGLIRALDWQSLSGYFCSVVRPSYPAHVVKDVPMQ